MNWAKAARDAFYGKAIQPDGHLNENLRDKLMCLQVDGHKPERYQTHPMLGYVWMERGGWSDEPCAKKLPGCVCQPTPSPPPSLSPPPSPSPPAATVCVGPEVQDRWFTESEVVYVKWAAPAAPPTAREACQEWCQKEIDEDCTLRMSVLSGHQVSCGFRTDPGPNSKLVGKCAVVTGLDLRVEARPTTESDPSYYAPAPGSPPICYVNPYKVVPCEPEPENACEASGADFAKGEELCGQLDPACQETSYDDCLADYCLLGGDNSVLDNTDSDCRQDDNQTERESPSPPPPSPSSPPVAHQPVGERQCVVDVKGVTHCVGLPPDRSLDDARVKARLKRSGIVLE